MARDDTVIEFTVGDRVLLEQVHSQQALQCNKLDDIKGLLEKPFPRCAANMTEIQNLKERAKGLEDYKKWSLRSTVAALVAIVTAVVASFVK